MKVVSPSADFRGSDLSFVHRLPIGTIARNSATNPRLVRRGRIVLNGYLGGTDLVHVPGSWFAFSLFSIAACFAAR